jgi:hypothetical protein
VESKKLSTQIQMVEFSLLRTGKCEKWKEIWSKGTKIQLCKMNEFWRSKYCMVTTVFNIILHTKNLLKEWILSLLITKKRGEIGLE